MYYGKFENRELKLVHLHRSAHYRNVPIVVSSTALLYPAYKNKNVAKRELVCAAGMYLSIRHVEFPKFQTGLFVECKGPRMSSSSESF